MQWIQYVVAPLFFLLGAACVVLVVVQLPGVWILLALAGVIEWLDGLYLSADDRQTFQWWVLITCVALALLGELIEFLAAVGGAKKAGSSNRGMWGALIGGILGVFIFTPVFFFIPLFGTFFGAVLGTFVGAVIGELTAEQATVRGSMKPAIGATIGRVVGTMSKVGIAIVVWLMLTVDAFV